MNTLILWTNPFEPTDSDTQETNIENNAIDQSVDKDKLANIDWR